MFCMDRRVAIRTVNQKEREDIHFKFDSMVDDGEIASVLFFVDGNHGHKIQPISRTELNEITTLFATSASFSRTSKPRKSLTGMDPVSSMSYVVTTMRRSAADEQGD